MKENIENKYSSRKCGQNDTYMLFIPKPQYKLRRYHRPGSLCVCGPRVLLKLAVGVYTSSYGMELGLDVKALCPDWSVLVMDGNRLSSDEYPAVAQFYLARGS